MSKNWLATVFIAATCVSSSSAADRLTPNDDCSTVKLFFVNIPISVPTDPARKKEMAHLGDIVLPTSEIRPASIYIDGEFVGNALSGYVDVKPSFRLPAGTHDFRIECDGCRTFESKLKVLGSGSEQWLVVTMRPEKAKGDEAKTSSKDQ